MFYQILLSPQVKRWAIITYKHGIYELPHELPNDLRFIRRLRNIRKVSKLHRMIAQPPVPLAKMIALPILAENSCKKKQKLNFSRCSLLHMKTRVSLKYPASYCRLYINMLSFVYIPS